MCGNDATINPVLNKTKVAIASIDKSRHVTSRHSHMHDVVKQWGKNIAQCTTTCSQGQRFSHVGSPRVHDQPKSCLQLLGVYVSHHPEEHFTTCARNRSCTNIDVLLTMRLSMTLVNDQLDAQFFYFIIRLLQSSTCFEQRRAHHQEVKLY